LYVDVIIKEKIAY